MKWMQDVNSQQCCQLANHLNFSEGQQYADEKGQKKGQVYFQIKSDVTFLEIQKKWPEMVLIWSLLRCRKGKKKKGKKKGFEGIRPKKEEKRAEESFWQLLQSITFFQMKVNTQANEGKHLIKWRHTFDQNLPQMKLNIQSNSIKWNIQ